jgi:hypothetical protein
MGWNPISIIPLSLTIFSNFFEIWVKEYGIYIIQQEYF